MIQKKLIIALFFVAILGGGEIWAQNVINTTIKYSVTLSYAQLSHRFEEAPITPLITRPTMVENKNGRGVSGFCNFTIMDHRVKWLNVDIGLGLTHTTKEDSYDGRQRTSIYYDFFLGQTVSKTYSSQIVNQYKNLYLDIPIHARINLYKKKYWLDVGATNRLGLIQSNTSQLVYRVSESNISGGNEEFKEIMLTKINKTSYDLGFSCGIEARVGKDLAILGRYHYSVIKRYELPEFNIYPRYIEVGVRYYFKKEKYFYE